MHTVIQFLYFSMKRRVIRGKRLSKGARGSVVVEALCYKPEDRGFETRCGGFFQFT
jgi:hypothetical protein